MGFSPPVAFFLILAICLPLFTALSASTFISDGVFGSSVSGQRRLLQAKKPCPVNFEFQNYTIILSRCEGPPYPANECCDALKDFACPFADYINDQSNDCSTIMFSYITGIGKYPQGLFASVCRETTRGLECPALPPPASQRSGVLRTMCPILPVLILAVASFLFSF